MLHVKYMWIKFILPTSVDLLKARCFLEVVLNRIERLNDCRMYYSITNEIQVIVLPYNEEDAINLILIDSVIFNDIKHRCSTMNILCGVDIIYMWCGSQVNRYDELIDVIGIK